MRIGIIGTGVAGSVLAAMLAAMLAEAPGIALEAFDRLGGPAAAAVGTGLNVGPNALKALRLHLPEQHVAVRAASLPWQRWSIAMADGEPLFDLNLLDVAEEAGIRLRWSELYRVLRAPVAAMVQHGLALEALEEDAAGRLVPVLRKADGGVLRPTGFDLLVAGDGRYSRLRSLTAGTPEPRFHGIALTRLLVPDATGCSYDEYGQWFNGHARLLSYRLPGGAAYIAGSVPLPHPAAEVPSAARTGAYQRCLYTPTDRPACQPVAWMCTMLERHAADIHWARLQDSPLLRGTLGGRVLFLGDAAHAMVPTLGQGATQAIEDGVVAGAVLRIGGATADVSHWRDERVEFVRRFSLEATDTMLPGTDPAAGARAKMGAEFLGKLRRLYTDVPGLDAFAQASACQPA